MFMQLRHVGKFWLIQLHSWRTNAGTEVWVEVISLIKQPWETSGLKKKIHPNPQPTTMGGGEQVSTHTYKSLFNHSFLPLGKGKICLFFIHLC